MAAIFRPPCGNGNACGRSGGAQACSRFGSLSWSSICSSCSDPGAQSPDHFLHLGAGAGIAQTNEPASVRGIEIEPWCDRHVNLREHALGELVTVAAKRRYIRIEVEGAIHRQNPVETDLG